MSTPTAGPPPFALDGTFTRDKLRELLAVQTDRRRLAEWTAPGTWDGVDAGVMLLAKPFPAAAARSSVWTVTPWSASASRRSGCTWAPTPLRRVKAESPPG